MFRLSASCSDLVALFASVLLCLVPVGGLSSQEITGRTLDGAGTSPIAGAEVRLVDADGEPVSAAIADSLGRFAVTAPGQGSYRVVAERIGYRRTESPLLRLSAGRTYPLDLLMELEPVPIDPIRVEVRAVRDRLERRRIASAARSVAIDREEFDDTPARDLGSYLAARAGAPLAPCQHQYRFRPVCFQYRNRLQPVCVYLDEVPLAGGIGALALYGGGYLERVEVYPAAGWIRVYSRQFMRRVKEGKEEILPLIMSQGCL